MSKENKVDSKKISALTEEEKEFVYREREKMYGMMDARIHLIEYFDDDEKFVDAQYDEGDYQYLWELFEAARDCNRAENDVWAEVVEKYMEIPF